MQTFDVALYNMLLFSGGATLARQNYSRFKKKTRFTRFYSFIIINSITLSIMQCIPLKLIFGNRPRRPNLIS